MKYALVSGGSLDAWYYDFIIIHALVVINYAIRGDHSFRLKLKINN